MKCEDAIQKTAGRALDELEARDRIGLEEHLQTCVACRAVAERAARTVAALRADDVDPSDVRRERAVAAMVEAHRTGSGIPRRRWMAASLAAAVLVALSVSFLLPKSGLSVERLDGAAVLVRSDGRRVSVALGDRLRPGDRLETQGVVTLEGRDRLEVVVHKDSKVLYETSEMVTLILESGAVRVDAPETPVAILNGRDRRAIVTGKCEARFTSVGGYPNDPSKSSQFQIYVKKGGVRFEGPAGAQALSEGQTMTVTDEGTTKVEERNEP
jgi:hypothetical protein